MCLSGIRHFDDLSDGLGQNIFRRRIEKMRPMGDQMYGNVFLSRQSWQILFLISD